MNFKIALALFAFAVLIAPAPTHAAQPTPLVTGIVQPANVVTSAGTLTGTFTGALTTTGFQATTGVINLIGTITGKVTNSAGTVIATLTNAPVTIPLTGLTGSCPILALHIGQITVHLLGLDVVLSPIDLVITAQAAPGNLLGNLLCAVAHLLDSGSPVASIADLLNQILAAL